MKGSLKRKIILPIMGSMTVTCTILFTFVYSNIRHSLIGTILLFLVFLCLNYFAVHWSVTSSVSKPFQKVLEGTEQIVRGKLDQKITIKGENEFSKLAETLNWMIEGIQKNKELEQEMKRLSSLNLLGEMASIMGHEIRNPLHTISLLLHLLTENEKYQDDREMLIMMKEEASRADSIITEYLSLTRHKPANFQATDLNEIIRNIFPLVQASAIAKKQTILLDLLAVPLIIADNKELRQLLHNLIRNGLEAMEINQQLWIRTRSDHDSVKLIIEDQGRGIPEHILGQIGTPFLTTKEHGIGLGLAICMRIVKRHRGDFHIVTSAQGTKFEVVFPITHEQDVIQSA